MRSSMWDIQTDKNVVVVETYQRIVSIVDETLSLMDDIDATTFLDRLADVGLGDFLLESKKPLSI